MVGCWKGPGSLPKLIFDVPEQWHPTGPALRGILEETATAKRTWLRSKEHYLRVSRQPSLASEVASSQGEQTAASATLSASTRAYDAQLLEAARGTSGATSARGRRICSASIAGC